MLIPLGILASSGGGAAGAYELISSTILSSATASITFNTTGLGATYKHLQVRALARTTKSGANFEYVKMTRNGSASTYNHILAGEGTGSPFSGAAASPESRVFLTSANSSASNAFGAAVIDILDPFTSTKNTTVRALSGNTDYNWIQLKSMFWNSATATTEIVFAPEGANNFVAGTRFSIYGLKG